MVTIDRLTTGYVGLSTDEKPTGCRNGDTFIEMDTCTLYAYDEAGQQWLKQSGSDSSGGGSSDGGDDGDVIFDGDITFTTQDDGGDSLNYGEFTVNKLPSSIAADLSITLELIPGNPLYVLANRVDDGRWEYVNDQSSIVVNIYDDEQGEIFLLPALELNNSIHVVITEHIQYE